MSDSCRCFTIFANTSRICASATPASGPAVRFWMSRSLMAAFISRNVETLSLSPDFIASLRAVLMSSRSAMSLLYSTTSCAGSTRASLLLERDHRVKPGDDEFGWALDPALSLQYGPPRFNPRTVSYAAQEDICAEKMARPCAATLGLGSA